MERQSFDGVSFETDHRLRMRVVWTGEIDVDAARAMQRYAATCRAQLEDDEHLTCIVTAGEAATMSKDARLILTKFRDQQLWQRIGVTGARFAVRVSLELLMRALTAMRRETADIAFFETEEEAIAWLEKPCPASP